MTLPPDTALPLNRWRPDADRVIVTGWGSAAKRTTAPRTERSRET